MIYNRATRRQFLTGSGKVFLALPILESLLPRAAWGQVVSEKRFVAVWLPFGGFDATDLYPTYAADLPTQLYQNHTIHQTNLRLSPGLNSISKIYTAALNPFLAKLNIIEGLDCPIGFTHGEATFLGHYRFARGAEGALEMYPDVPSIDQFLAYSRKFYPQIPVCRSINGSSGFMASGRRKLIDPANPSSGTMSFSPDSSPLKIFTDLFGPSTPPVSTTSTGPSARQLQSKTIIDQVLVDLNAVRSSRQISSADKIKIDSFAAEMHEMQQKIVAVMPAYPMCTKPGTPTDKLRLDQLDTNISREQFYDLYTSIIAAGLKCGRTKIATLEGHANIESVNLHAWGHNGNRTDVADTMRWVLEKVYIPLLQKLNVEESGGKTYLDNSLVIYGNDNSKIHKSWSRPILTAGSAGGFLKTGNYVDYRRRGILTRYTQYGTGLFPEHEMYPGILYNQFLVTVLQAMGLSASDYETPGVLGYSGAALIGNDATDGANELDKATGIHVHSHCIQDAGKLLPLLTRAS